MGPEIPSALAGSKGEIELNEDGARRVVQLITGTAIGAGILAAGAMLYRKVAGIVGANKNVGELY